MYRIYINIFVDFFFITQLRFNLFRCGIIFYHPFPLHWQIITGLAVCVVYGRLHSVAVIVFIFRETAATGARLLRFLFRFVFFPLSGRRAIYRGGGRLHATYVWRVADVPVCPQVFLCSSVPTRVKEEILSVFFLLYGCSNHLENRNLEFFSIHTYLCVLYIIYVKRIFTWQTYICTRVQSD